MAVISGAATAGTNVTLRARVASPDGTNLTQSAVSTITCTVRDEQTGTNITPNPTIVVASTVYDTLQAWPNNDPDTTGYNFAYELTGATYIPTAGKFYFITFTFTLTDSTLVYVEFEVWARPLQSAYAQDAELSVTYRQLQAAVARYLGWRRDYNEWSAEEVADLNDIIRNGLRQFYFPPPVKEGELYRWTFLSPESSISLSASDYDYDLASDYAGNAREFIFGAGSDEKPLTPITVAQLRALQSRSSESGTPAYYALRPQSSDGTAGQLWEVLFYPTPNASATIYYRYDVDPGMVTTAAPYPYGGAIHAKTIIESCLASAEEWKQDASGVHRELFKAALLASIQQDRTGTGPGAKEAWPIDTAEPTTLDVTYVQLLRHVGHYLGKGWDDAKWSRDVRHLADEMVQLGLRQFYFPPSEKEVTVPHWTFLEKSGTLTLSSDTQTVEMPEDFGGEIVGDLTYSDGSNLISLRRVSDERIRELRVANDTTKAPEYYALRSDAPAGQGRQKFSLVLYPTPDTTYSVTVRYVSVPPRLTQTNPFPLGGVAHAETILASCLAAAEKRLKSGDNTCQAQFKDRLVASVRLDRQVGMREDTWPVGVETPETLDLTYSDILRRVGHNIGLGWDQGTWSREERQRVELSIHDGLRQFYTPPVLPGEKTSHRWSFLAPVTTMATTEDTSTVDLPADFAYMVGPLTFEPGDTVLYEPIEIVPEHIVRAKLSRDESTGRPELCAIRPKSIDGGGTRYQAVFYPTPDDAYTFYYRYVVNLPPLSEENAHPPGGQQHAQTILESCLAASEQLGGKGTKHTEKFMERLRASISADRAVASPDFAGYNRDLSDRLEDWFCTMGHNWSTDVVTYNGVSY